MSAPRSSCPLAGPLASSTGARNPRHGAVIWLVVPITLYPFPFFSFFSLLTPPAPLAGSPKLAVAVGARGRGGRL
jgi:4-amino-4-deoxy-L-arabinose transferase-like glycosyltransferase